MSLMDEYVTARANFCAAKANLKKHLTEAKYVYNQIIYNTNKFSFSEGGDQAGHHWTVDPIRWPDRSDLVSLVESFRETRAAMNAAYDALSKDQKSAMAPPESSDLGLAERNY